MSICHTATVGINILSFLWHLRYNKGKQYVSPKDWLILTDLHGVTNLKNRIYIASLWQPQILGKPNVCRTVATATACCLVSGLN